MDALSQFKEIFWDSFHRPNLKTPKLMHTWEMLEEINNLLAGPFYSIYEKGNCNYIFLEKNRFQNITGPDDFLSRCIELIEKYKIHVEETEANTEDELSDKKILLYQTDIKMELAELAHIILKQSFNKTTQS